MITSICDQKKQVKEIALIIVISIIYCFIEKIGKRKYSILRRLVNDKRISYKKQINNIF